MNVRGIDINCAAGRVVFTATFVSHEHKRQERKSVADRVMRRMMIVLCECKWH